LEKAIKQDTLCLSVASPDDPFPICLVGLPADVWPIPDNSTHMKDNNPNSIWKHNPLDAWDHWTQKLPHASLELQELKIIVSVKMDFRKRFFYKSKKERRIIRKDVSPYHPVYKTQSQWCNYTSPITSQSSNYPLQLPQGVFLTCRDRAWLDTPSHIKSGPCSLGRLTLLAPNIKMIHNKENRAKISTHYFESDCNDDVTYWSKGKRIVASLLLPWVATAKALGQLDHLGCLLSKQTNTTSLALSGLLSDVDTIRHTTLKNRAAIDFLLLAHGHGCKDFEGMCCTNLSDHSESIHHSIQILKE
ncbi:hypothetical protein Nmel_001906, partial [Mimus melanotis]